MQGPDKPQFLKSYGFPREWETWGFYPDELFRLQLDAVKGDAEPQPDEHLRYGAFSWWVRRQRELTEHQLIQLCQLAALDPDPAMAGAAVHDILFHSMASIRVATAAAELAKGHKGWDHWFAGEDKCTVFLGIFQKSRLFWAERASVHRLAVDLREQQLTAAELRELHATGIPLVLRGLVEHPRLPDDLLSQLSELRSGPFSKVIRSLAARRAAGQRVAPTGYAEKYSSHPWSWPR
jgi:hypothetical protein